MMNEPDEQGDVGERQQELVEEAEVLLEGGLLLRGVGFAGDHLVVPGSTASSTPMASASSSLVLLPSDGHDDVVVVAGLGEQLLGGAVVDGHHGGAGEPVDLAEVAVPTRVRSRGSPTARTVRVSPRAQPSRSADAASITTSSGPDGGVALGDREGVEAGVGDPVACRWWRLRPSLTRASPLASTSWAKPWMEPAARLDAVDGAGPGRAVAASTRSRASPNSASTATGRWTTTSMPALLVANRPSKVLSIVSVRTIVPAMKATPSTTARPVSAKRSLWAQRPLDGEREHGVLPSEVLHAVEDRVGGGLRGARRRSGRRRGRRRGRRSRRRRGRG